jgi:hypothetical protein
MNALFTSWFGASWRTTLFGVIQLLAGTALNYLQSLTPGDTFNWTFFSMQVLVAVLALMSKDKEVHGGTIASGETPTTADTKAATAIVDAKATGTNK